MVSFQIAVYYQYSQITSLFFFFTCKKDQIEKQRKHESTEDMRMQIYERRGKEYLSKKLTIERKHVELFPESANSRRNPFLVS